MEIDQGTQDAIKAFKSANKPIGTSSQAGILVAGVLGKKNKGPGVQITVGRAEKEQVEAVNALGNKLIESTNVVVDEQNLIVSTGGNLNAPNVDPLDLSNSMRALVDETLKLVRK